jgi:hypothetical protein
MAYIKNERMAVKETYDLTDLSDKELGTIIMALKSLPNIGGYGDLVYNMKDSIEGFEALDATMVTSFARRLTRLYKGE